MTGRIGQQGPSAFVRAIVAAVGTFQTSDAPKVGADNPDMNDVANDLANIEESEPAQTMCGFCIKRPSKGMLQNMSPKKGQPEFVPVCEHCHAKLVFGKKLRWPVVTKASLARRAAEVTGIQSPVDGMGTPENPVVLK